MLELLKYELIYTYYFLTTESKHGILLRKPNKRTLSREPLKQLPKKTQNVQFDAQMTAVDFMALLLRLLIDRH